MPSLSSLYLTQRMVLMAAAAMSDRKQDVLAHFAYSPPTLQQACSQ